MSKVNTLLVIGAGQMGGGIAQIAAVAGLKVYTFDVIESQLERCEKLHNKLLNRAVEKGKMEQADADAALGRIQLYQEHGRRRARRLGRRSRHREP
jgi:3-hydroxybutyryl-CoA dehydrogenase